MTENILVLNKVSKKYAKTFALENITLEIEKKAIVGIVGPNGAGKSTLLKIISGILQPDKGEIFYLGKKRDFFEIMDLISYLPEYVDIYPDFYVSEIAGFFNLSFLNSDNSLFSLLGLEQVSHKKVKHLSKGYKQRLKLYIALSNNKEIVLLDEPFDGFDPIQLKEMVMLVKKQNEKGKTFILSLHHLYHAEKICNFFVLLKDGKLILKGTMDDFRARFQKDDLALEEVFERVLL